jgi:transmembrane sensor
MDNQKAKELLIKYSEGKCTPEEKAWVESWYLMDETVANKVSHQEVKTAIEAVRANLPQPSKPALPLWPRIAVAASIIFALSFGVYLVLQKRHSRQIAQNQRQDIAPGRNQATLTLPTGQKIVLTQTLNGQLAMLGNTMVKAQGGSGVSYTKGATAGPAVEKMAYNILSTVRGEKSPYPLILSDGTKVWLNAASSITFPTIFNDV